MAQVQSERAAYQDRKEGANVELHVSVLICAPDSHSQMTNE